MKHVVTLSSGRLMESLQNKGCGECQNSCQSACKTSCTVGNQVCLSSQRSEKVDFVDFRGFNE